MFTACCPLILASASPRRQEYLAQLGLQYQIIPATIDEIAEPGELPQQFSRRMAASKAKQVADDHPDSCIIAADTVVALDHHIFGKPRDKREALAMLMALQGRTHAVTTGFALFSRNRNIEEVASVTTEVTFGQFTEAILQAYVNSGDPMDKAGAYGIQGAGSFLVHSVTGSCSNVAGLPIHAVVQSLLRHGLLNIC